jgi:dienelactone hydrolase
MIRRLLLWSLIVIAVTVAGVSGCALGLRGALPPPTADSLSGSDAHMKAAGFAVMPDAVNSSQPATFNDIRRVYVAGAGRNAPRVIVLHELPGLRDGDIHVAAELAKSFEVYVPLMFGDAGQDDAGRGNRQACKSGLFNCNDRNTRHPIVTDLLAMTRQICRDTDCGVIGMCLTGTVPLSLMEADRVVALVLAQPTLPIVWHVWPFNGLDISEADTAAAMRAAEQRKASIYMLRYRHDWISGHGAFNRLRDRIAPSKDKLTFFEVKEVDGRGHSTLVHDAKHPEVAKEQLAVVVKALNARLRNSSGT